MQIRSNRIADIKDYYFRLLNEQYNENESRAMIYMLFEHYVGISKSDLLISGDKHISESMIVNIHKGCRDLLKHIPIQYILGETEFYDHRFLVDKSVLIPRPETEELVHRILQKERTKTALKILDIGTGSGCIAISLAIGLKDARVSAVDISKEALQTAAKNAELHKVTIDFIEADILKDNPEGDWDIIVSNPPYVKNSEKALMQKNVLAYEPELALFVEDTDALCYYKRITEYAQSHLKKDGELWFEINEAHGEETKELIQKHFFNKCVIIQDIFNKNRMVYGEK